VKHRLDYEANRPGHAPVEATLLSAAFAAIYLACSGCTSPPLTGSAAGYAARA
jgi:hypothetical protein